MQVLHDIEVYQMVEEMKNPPKKVIEFATLYKVEDELFNQTGITEQELVDAIKDWKLDEDADYKQMI